MKKKIETKSCSGCGKSFATHLRSKRYCDACNPIERAKIHNKVWTERDCDNCGTPYLPKSKVSRFCSPPCRTNYHSANKSATTAAQASPRETVNGVKIPIVPKCKLCDEEFIRKGKGRILYCLPCREKYPTTIPRKAENPCKNCREDFFHMRPQAKFCSLSCSSTWINAEGLGPRHNDRQLLARIVDVIKQHERCLSQEELMSEAETTHKVLGSRKWTMEYLYEAAGRAYERPKLNSRFEDRVADVLRKVFPGMEIEHDKELPGMLGFKQGKLRADFYIHPLRLIVEADGGQHIDGRDDCDKLDEICANDRLKNEYAAANGIILIRIPETQDRRKIKSELLRALRRNGIRLRGLGSRNTEETAEPACGVIIRSKSPRQKAPKIDPKTAPLEDVYCRGCHTRPSYKNKNTYLCATCWEGSKKLYDCFRVLPTSDVTGFKDKLIFFIKARGRYVWHPEVSLNLYPISAADLKIHGIEVARICRDLGFFAPADDRFTRETTQRISDFVTEFQAENKRFPNVKEVLAQANIDHTTLWSCMDYGAFIAERSGKIKTEIRHRFRNPQEFLQAASEVVRKSGCRMRMTAILEEIDISYPTYRKHFKSIRPDQIHEKAGVLYHGTKCGEPQNRPEQE